MPSNRGTFQGNLEGTGSRILEMLTSSKAVTASYAITASRLSAGNVGSTGNPVYFENGVPKADAKAEAVINWVTANSDSLAGYTGSSSGSNVQVQELVSKSGSWEGTTNWINSNSASLLNKTSSLTISASVGAPSESAVIYTPNGGNRTIKIVVPSNPGHIGAASASHTHTFAQITDGTAISASVKRLETSASLLKNTYVTTASFNTYVSGTNAAISNLSGNYLPLSGGTLTGELKTADVVVVGNLTVQGTTTTVDTENLNVKDKLILVASSASSRATADGAGIAIPTASAGENGAARIQYDGTNNVFTASVGFKAPGFTGSLLGTASYAVSASKAVSASYSVSASRAVSAASATSASYATSASQAIKATSASYASTATSASFAVTAAVAESIRDSSGLTVKSADTASYVEWNNVSGHPTFVSATFQTGAFTGKVYDPVGTAQTINIPSTTTHISGLNAITASVKQMVAKTASWDGVASTASAAYQSASKALATASVAQREAESASFYKTQASASAADADYFALEAEDRMIDAGNYAEEASGSMEDARIYRANAATNATLTSTYAVQASASAVLAAASASSAATYATRAQQSASNAHTSKTLAAASASAASSSAATAANWAVSASASATRISASTAEAAQYASNASASASLMYKNVGSATQPVFMSASVGPVAATPYESASVKEAVTASYANSVSVAAVNTNASLPILIAAAATPANPGPVKYDTNLTYNASTNRLNVTHVSATGLTGSLRGNVTGTASFATSASRAISAASADSATSATSASYAANSTTASYALIAEAVKDGAGLVVNTASYALEAGTAKTASYNAEAAALRTIITNNSASWAQDNDTKVTSVGNHYKATGQISGSQGGTNTTYVHAITLDAAGHVTAVSTTNTSSIKAASASFATSASYASSSTSASFAGYAGNAGQLAGQAASNYALKSYTDGAYLPITGGVITGNLTVQQNLTVAGSASYLNTTDLLIEDRLILVASGSTSKTDANGAGIAVQTGSASTPAAAEAAAARFQYDGTNDIFTASVGIKSVKGFTGSLLGTASYTLTASKLSSTLGLILAGSSSSWIIPVMDRTASGIGARTYNVIDQTIFTLVAEKPTLPSNAPTTESLIADTLDYVRFPSASVTAKSFTGSLEGTASYALSASHAGMALQALAATEADSAIDAEYAISAIKLEGSSGSVGVPVYFDAGVPKACVGIATTASTAAAINALVTASGSTWAADTKVTSAANHYKATGQISGSQGGTNTTYVHAITLDAAGHVTAVSTTNTSSINAASATSASHVPFATFAQTNGVYLTASVGNTTKTAAINSASRAVSAETADTAVKATMIDSASNQVIYDPTAQCFRFVFA